MSTATGKGFDGQPLYPHSEKRYACARCGHVVVQTTNHFGPVTSWGHTNACPNCPPWAKYPEFGGQTVWKCLDGPAGDEHERTVTEARQLVDQLIPETDDWEKEVVAIVHALQQAGFHVESDGGGSVRLKIVDDPEGPATNLLTGEPAGIKMFGADEPDGEDDYAAYEVYPKKNWNAFVKRCDQRGTDWTEYSTARGDEFEDILKRFGYELGGVGGHPPNFDYGRSFPKPGGGDVHVSFNFWGNPHHI